MNLCIQIYLAYLLSVVKFLILFCIQNCIIFPIIYRLSFVGKRSRQYIVAAEQNAAMDLQAYYDNLLFASDGDLENQPSVS